MPKNEMDLNFDDVSKVKVFNDIVLPLIDARLNVYVQKAFKDALDMNYDMMNKGIYDK